MLQTALTEMASWWIKWEDSLCRWAGGPSAHGSLLELNDSLLAQFKKKKKKMFLGFRVPEWRIKAEQLCQQLTTFPFLESRCVPSFYPVANDFNWICTIVFVLTVLNSLCPNELQSVFKKSPSLHWPISEYPGAPAAVPVSKILLFCVKRKYLK